jgi:hypothetical protein
MTAHNVAIAGYCAKLPYLLAFVVSTVVSLPALAQTPNLRPGNYEQTDEVSMPGRPSKNPPRKAVVCLGEQDVKDLGKIPIGDNARQMWKDSDQKVTGNKITVTRTCTIADGTILCSPSR